MERERRKSRGVSELMRQRRAQAATMWGKGRLKETDVAAVVVKNRYDLGEGIGRKLDGCTVKVVDERLGLIELVPLRALDIRSTLRHMLGLYSCQRKYFTGKACADTPGAAALCALCWVCQALSVEVPTLQDLMAYYKKER